MIVKGGLPTPLSLCYPIKVIKRHMEPTNSRLTAEDLRLLLNGLDAALDYMEALDEDVLAGVYDAYNKIFEAREEFLEEQNELLTDLERDHLERCFLAS